jgi:hypothetical protein
MSPGVKIKVEGERNTLQTAKRSPSKCKRTPNQKYSPSDQGKQEQHIQ